jgi:hypothetical protein
MEMNDAAAFHARLKGTFYGILQWQQLDHLWGLVKGGQWYFYQIGEVPPIETLSGGELAERIEALDTLLRQEHEYDYCGIVYADDVENPTLIKVYDPNNLGSACSRSTTPTPPLWILSVVRPPLIENQAPVPNNRKRWWQRFFS